MRVRESERCMYYLIQLKKSMKRSASIVNNLLQKKINKTI